MKSNMLVLAFKAWYDFTSLAAPRKRVEKVDLRLRGYSSPENRHGLRMFDAFKRESYGGFAVCVSDPGS